LCSRGVERGNGKDRPKKLTREREKSYNASHPPKTGKVKKLVHCQMVQ